MCPQVFDDKGAFNDWFGDALGGGEDGGATQIFCLGLGLGFRGMCISDSHMLQ